MPPVEVTILKKGIFVQFFFFKKNQENNKKIIRMTKKSVELQRGKKSEKFSKINRRGNPLPLGAAARTQ